MERNLNWLLNGYGFEAKENDRGFDLSALTQYNRDFCLQILSELGISYVKFGQMIETDVTRFDEKIWRESIEQHCESQTGAFFKEGEIQLTFIDSFISGVVMQLNRLGCVTTLSCDGHEKRKPTVYFETLDFTQKAQSILEAVGVSVRRNRLSLWSETERENLPSIAVTLSKISKEKASGIYMKSAELMLKGKFLHQLEEVLNIPGESGNESAIRMFVIEELKPFVDHMTTDHYGNILGEKRFGSGPTVLLNAHLDTVERIIEGREIVKDGDVWTSSEGILGADDRAGVNVVLAIAKSLNKKQFDGTIKYIFTVEEEIGLCGAREVTQSFLWDVDMAFVIDRRGTYDIVTSRGGYDAFCSKNFQRVLERTAQGCKLGPWKAVDGGSSDTFIWAKNGIESVNLSAGYQFEHTCNEQLNVTACYGTYQFLMEILHQSREIYRVVKRKRITA